MESAREKKNDGEAIKGKIMEWLLFRCFADDSGTAGNDDGVQLVVAWRAHRVRGAEDNPEEAGGEERGRRRRRRRRRRRGRRRRRRKKEGRLAEIRKRKWEKGRKVGSGKGKGKGRGKRGGGRSRRGASSTDFPVIGDIVELWGAAKVADVRYEPCPYPCHQLTVTNGTTTTEEEEEEERRRKRIGRRAATDAEESRVTTPCLVL